MRVQELNLGLLEPAGGPVGLSGCRCLLLDTNDGAVLIDTGFGTAELQFPEKFFGQDVDTKWKIRRDPSLAALSQVEALGLRRRDVRHILCTHLDMDHAGGLVDFPHASVHVSFREYNDLMAGNTRYLPHQFAHGPCWVVYGGHTSFGTGGLSGLLSGGQSGWRIRFGKGDEVALVPLYGHSAGHCGVAIEITEGTLLHCGDSYYRRSELNPGYTAENDFPVRTAEDNSLRLTTLDLLSKAMSENVRLRLFSTHDRAERVKD